MRTFGPDHKNIIDISQPSVGLEWGILQSFALEITQVKVSMKVSHFSEYSFYY